ncbi:hypothetical protein JXA32_09480 [Candidatus Sumerlaeota bacterium]|nr:hypothetical protein [Candidatus Sumerlaeota bacterium]
MPDPLNGETKHLKFIRLAIGCAFLLSSAAIIAAARGDLWLDEIWSLAFAHDARSAADIFLHYHHDNNHPLCTLFLYCVGEPDCLYVYRLLSVLSGIGAVLLAGFVAKEEWGYPEALCSVVLIGSSYPLLLYFSEARGYAPAIFFGLAAYAALRHNLRSRHWATLVLFWPASILGMLSHATFIMLSASLFLASLAHQVQAHESIRRGIMRLLAQHYVPLTFFAWWYVFYLKDMEIGGGPVYRTWAVIGQASALIFGLPDAVAFHVANITAFHAVAIIFILLVVVPGVAILYWRHDLQWIFFLAMLLIMPAAMLILSRPKFLYFRYFIICFPFFLLLLAQLACHCSRLCPPRWRWLAFAPIVLVVAGQIPRDYHLLVTGRGDYSAALEYILAASPDGPITVGSDHDFRNGMVIGFYAHRITGGERLRYLDQSRWLVESPEWIFAHNQDRTFQPIQEHALKGIGVYRLIKVFPFSGISGWNWVLYRRSFEPPAP